MTGSKTRAGDMAIIAIMAALIATTMVLSGLYPDLPYLHLIATLCFFAFIAIFVIITERDIKKKVTSIKKVTLFRQGLRVEEGKLILPEEVEVELGEVVLKEYYTRTPPDSLSAMQTREPKRFHISEVYVSNPVKTRLKTVDLGELCSKPFFLFVDSWKSTYVLEAPGFKVTSGRFKDVVVVCLERLSVPEKTIELVAGDSGEHGSARVKLDPKGLKTIVTWVFKAPVQSRVVYDEKRGVYKVVEEYTVKPEARGVRAELCIQTPGEKHCETFARAVEPNKPVEVAIPFTVKERLLVFDTLLPSIEIRRAVEKHVFSVVGYKPNYLTVRVVLETKKGQEIVSETPL